MVRALQPFHNCSPIAELWASHEAAQGFVSTSTWSEALLTGPSFFFLSFCKCQTHTEVCSFLFIPYELFIQLISYITDFILICFPEEMYMDNLNKVSKSMILIGLELYDITKIIRSHTVILKNPNENHMLTLTSSE